MFDPNDLFEPGLNSLLFEEEDPSAARITALEEEILRRGELLREQEQTLDALREDLNRAREETVRVRQRYHTGIRLAAGIVGLSLVLALGPELCQVGWNLFRTVTDVLGLPREDVIGGLTAAAAAFALWQAGKWTLRAALADLEENDEKERNHV